MFDRAWLGLLLFTGCIAGPGSPDGGPGVLAPLELGQKPLADLDAPCGEVAGLNGNAVLAQKTEQISTRLAYVTAEGKFVEPSPLTLELTWPASPTAVCYPAYSQPGVIAAARVAIDGLTMRFKTEDGKLDETLSARGWISHSQGNPGAPWVAAITLKGALKGSWKPFPEYEGTASTLSFYTQLAGAESAGRGGTMTLSVNDPREMEAGIYRSTFAVALWPR
jgi:hypothetical protein